MTSKITKAVVGLGALGLLGVAILPLTAYAYDTSVDVNVTVGAATQIDDGDTSGASGCSGSVDITPATIGSTIGFQKCYLTVKTNNSTGYTLSVKYADGNGAAVTSLYNTSATIPAVGTAYTASTLNGTGAALAANTSAWGFNVANQGTESQLASNGTFFAPPTAYTTVAATSGVATGNGYAFGFGAGVSAAQAQGSYSGELQIRAVSNP